MSTAPFLGREHEFKLMNNLTTKHSASLVVISGRRRIGKSRFISEFGKRCKFYSFVGLPPSQAKTAQAQRAFFAKRLSQQFSMPMPPHDDWTDLFWYLADRVQTGGRIVLLLDELSWMAQGDPDFLGKLKTAWDEQFKKNTKLILVLCSSISLWMEENIIKSTGFMGRLSLHLHLTELPLPLCNAFWGKYSQRISAFEKLKFLSVSGGVPRYLEEIKPKLSAEENIKQLCFDRRGVLYQEFDNIFSDLFKANSDRYKKIVTVLATGDKEYNEICKLLHTTPSSVISGYLEELEKAGFVSRDYGWDIRSSKRSSISRFRLSDNYLRFYLKTILPNQQRILSDEYIDASIENLPGWETIIGLQFENLVLNNRKTIKKILNIQAGDTLVDGSYYQRKTSKHPACQVDYMIQTKFNTVYVCEVKFRKNNIGKKVIVECERKISALKLPPGFSCRPVLIHVNGVQDTVINSEYFAAIINFSELLQ